MHCCGGRRVACESKELQPTRLPLQVYFGAVAASFSKRGSFRSGSNIGSSWRSAGVSGVPVARPPLHGIESIFCKAAMARSGSPRRAAIRARMSIDCGLFAASFSIGCKAMARSTSVKAAALSPRPAAMSARSPSRDQLSGCSLRKVSSSARPSRQVS